MGKAWTNKNIARSVQFGRKLYPSYRHDASARTRIFNRSLDVDPPYAQVPWIGNDPTVEMTLGGARTDIPIRISPKYSESVQATIFYGNESYTMPDGSTRMKAKRHLWLGATFIVEPEDSGDFFSSTSYYQAFLDGKRLVTACWVYRDVMDLGGLLISTYKVSGKDGEKVITLQQRKRVEIPRVTSDNITVPGHAVDGLKNLVHYTHLTKYGFTTSWSELDKTDAAPEVWTLPANRYIGWVLVTGFDIAGSMTQRLAESWTQVVVPKPIMTPGYAYDNIKDFQSSDVCDFGGKSYVWLTKDNYETTYSGVQPSVPLDGDPVQAMPVIPANRLATYQLTLKYVELKPDEEKEHIVNHYQVRGVSADYWVIHAAPDYLSRYYYHFPDDIGYRDLTEINGSIEDDSGGDRYNYIVVIPDKDVKIAQLRSRSVVIGSEYVEYVPPTGGEPGYYHMFEGEDTTYSDDQDNGLVFMRNGEEIDLKDIIKQSVGANVGLTWPGAFDKPAICYNGKFLMLEFFRNYEAVVVIDLSKPEFTCKVFRGSWDMTGAYSTVRPVTASGTSF